MITSWIARIGQSLKRSSRRKNDQGRGVVPAAERLEERSLLSAQAFFLNGQIDVVLESTDSVAVTENPVSPGTVQILINGSPVAAFPAVSTSAVTRISITGGDDANLIDLTGVTSAVFNNPALSIEAHGGNGADTLLGSDSLGDSLDGGHGADSIVGNGGNDTLLGDDGNDTIAGGVGDDSIDAGDGQDTVDGGNGDDTIFAGNGQDSVTGSAGADSIDGGNGDDTLFGGDDDDILNGGAGNDSIDGQNGSDSIFGGADNDTLLGGSGADSVDGQGGNDVLFAEDANGQAPVSTTFISTTAFSTNFNGSLPPELSGTTTTASVQSYAGIGTGANVFGGNLLHNDTGTGAPNGSNLTPQTPTTLTLTNLPTHTSIDINFLLAIINSWDGLNPGAVGMDFFNVRVDGTQLFRGSFDNNTATGVDQGYLAPAGVQLTPRPFVNLGFPGTSTLLDSAWNLGLDPLFDNIPHTASTLTIEFFADGPGFQGSTNESWGIDNLEVILNGVPVVTTILSNDILLGSAGNDTLNGADGNDVLNGGAGNDLLDGGNGNDSLLGGNDNDSLIGGNGDDTLKGQAGNDTLTGTTGADSLDGGAGNDLIQSIGAALSIADATPILEGSADPFLVFTVTLVAPTVQSVSVGFQTVNGTATAGNDYVATSGTLVFAPGESVKQIIVQVLDDALGEGNEFFTVELISVTNGTILNGTATGTILDDDISVSIADAGSITEGNAGTSTLNFTVSLSIPSTGPVSVDFATADGTAQGVQDYTGVTNTLTFAPGTTTATIAVTILGDTNPENDEQFFVNLSNPNGMVIADSQGIGTILDDDGGPAFTLADLNVSTVQRWTTTATDGPGLVQGQATTLTWGIVPDGLTLDTAAPSNLIARLDLIYNETATGPDVTNRSWFTLFESVFDSLAANTGLTFVFEPNDDRAPFVVSAGVLGVRPDLRIGGRDIDGNSGILAFNFFPNFGDMVIDTNDNFYLNTSNNSLGFRNVVAHEVGHGVGLFHVLTTNETKLMEPFISTAYDGPQEDEILKLNRAYGDRNERSGGNDTAATATTLGSLAAGDTVDVQTVSIHGITDVDFYEFTLLEDADVTITVTPTGTLYQSGPQPPGGGGTGPTVAFNAATLVDLTFDLRAADGTTLLNSVNVTGFGQAEQLVDLALAAGTYFVQVSGLQDLVQMYDVTVSSTSSATTPIAAPFLDAGDTLLGGDGNDLIIGHNGDDVINGGGGNDTLLGNGGADSISGGSGADSLNGGIGDDTLAGQGGRDTLVGGEDNDTFVWNIGDGDDEVSSLGGFDQMLVTGTNAADTVSVGKLGPRLQVTSGSNVLTVNADIHVVTIDLGAGDDVLTVGNLSGVAQTVLTVNGGDGNDALDASGSVPGDVRLLFFGNAGNDRLTGSPNEDTLDGGDGNDTLLGGSGNDLILGGVGNDAVNGQGGDDSITGDDGNDTLAGGDGNDTVRGGLGNDSLNGQTGNDVLDGDEGRDTLLGGDGNDSLDAGGGKDYLSGGNGNDTLDGGRNDDTIFGDAGADSIRGNHGNDTIDAGTGDDTVSGGDGNDSITGGDGNDLMTGADGNDILNGAAGNDTLTGGDGNDILAGGAGNDLLLGDDGDDTLRGNGGTNTLAGGQGDDVIVSQPTDVINENFVLSDDLLDKLDLL